MKRSISVWSATIAIAVLAVTALVLAATAEAGPAAVDTPKVAVLTDPINVVEGTSTEAFGPTINNAPPGATWTWSASIADTTKATVSVLTDSTNRDTGQKVRVTGVGDTDSDAEETTLTLTVSSANADINGLSGTFDVWVDDDEATLKLVFDQGSYSWDENSTGQRIGYKLATNPHQLQVYVTPPASLGSYASRTDGTSSFKFTGSTWNEFQYATYSVNHDKGDFDDHDVTFLPESITVYRGRVTTDQGYAALGDADKSATVTINNIDPPITIEEKYFVDPAARKLHIIEGDGAEINPMDLPLGITGAPDGATWTWSASSSDTSLVQASVVDVNGQDTLRLQFLDNDDHQEPATVTVTVEVDSQNTALDGLSETVTAWIEDTDGSNTLHYDQDSYSWDEDSGTNRIGVKVGWWPGRQDSMSVWFLPSIGGGRAALVGEGTLTFTFNNWNEYQYVTYDTLHMEDDKEDHAVSSVVSLMKYHDNDPDDSDRTIPHNEPAVTINNIDPVISIAGDGIVDAATNKVYTWAGKEPDPDPTDLDLDIDNAPSGATWTWSASSGDTSMVLASVVDVNGQDTLRLRFPGNEDHEEPATVTVTVEVDSANTDIDGLTDTVTVWVRDNNGEGDLYYDQDSYSWDEDTDDNRIGAKIGGWPDRGDSVSVSFPASLGGGRAQVVGERTLTFTYENWNEYQYVTYQTVHRATDRDDHTFNMSLDGSALYDDLDGDDYRYRIGHAAPAVTINNIDQGPTIIFPFNPINLNEGAQFSMIAMSISPLPAGASYQWHASIADTSAFSVSLTPDGIFAGNRVNVTARQDSDSDSEASILTVTAVSSHPDVNGIQKRFKVWVNDDEASRGLVFDRGSYSWDENSVGNRIGFKLATAPGGTHYVRVDPPQTIGNYATRSDGTGNLSFTKQTWNEYQYVTYDVFSRCR